jgi:cytochrome d ubiquinol oxidase subunit I
VITLLAGWFTTEMGRQPYVIYGLMRTKDALSPVSAPQIGVSLLIFVVVYFVVFGVGIYYLLRLMHQGPDATPAKDSLQKQPAGPGHFRTPMRPLSGADEQLEDTKGDSK